MSTNSASWITISAEWNNNVELITRKILKQKWNTNNTNWIKHVPFPHYSRFEPIVHAHWKVLDLFISVCCLFVRQLDHPCHYLYLCVLITINTCHNLHYAYVFQINHLLKLFFSFNHSRLNYLITLKKINIQSIKDELTSNYQLRV